MIKEGLTHTSRMTVAEEHTAKIIGSGDMDVLATPAMLALMENAAMLAVAGVLQQGETTVGGHIESSHLKPSPIGTAVEATATLVKVEGKKLFFDIVAMQGDVLIGKGTHLRFVVDKEKFVSRL
ncbi:MAG: thioesterase family protein [Bacteroides sp.]|nr:thioesterase family protein [Roseburia sp.]MCM1346777.1 thioesterase family protein [Bacteroides sp.]MCM1420657.1 thioesterase family protein [Bacteroides sp.]